MEVEKLLVKVNSGKSLTASELKEVLGFLEKIDVAKADSGILIEDIYAAVLIVGRVRDVSKRYLLAKFLELHDPLTVGLLLEILCLDWKLTADYLERLISFSLGVPWDEDEDVRQVALKILGEYLRERCKKEKLQTRDEQVLSLLISLYEEMETAYDIRLSAYAALCRAQGKDWEEVPTPFSKMDFAKDVDFKMLDQLRRLSSSAA